MEKGTERKGGEGREGLEQQKSKKALKSSDSVLQGKKSV